MNVDNLKWQDSRSPVNDEEIRQIESRLGVKFPKDFVECVKKYHGGFPRVSDFSYVDKRLRRSASCFGELFSFDLQDRINIVSDNELPPEGYPKGLIMFGQDGGGGYLCFDYRTTKTSPKVVFWISDAPSAEEVIPLADTFTDFLEMLYEPRDVPGE